MGCYVCPAASPTNCFFRKYTAHNHWSKFEEIIYNYAASVGRDRAWVDNDYWRLRRPKIDNINAGRSSVLKGRQDPFSVGTQKKLCSDENVFLYKLKPSIKIGLQELEFFKPFGKISLSSIGNNSFFQVHRSNPVSITGIVPGNKVKVRFNSTSFIKSKRLFERQLNKGLNCIGCGGCIGICRKGAISIEQGANKISIDEEKCTHCLDCVRTNFVSQGCIALNFSLKRKVLVKEEN